MFKLTCLIVLATTGLFQLATGSPLTSIPSRRDSNESVYLVNCVVGGAGGYSEMDYYFNAKSGSQNGEQPDAGVDITVNGYILWEGQEVCGSFSESGERFCSNIIPNGQSLATGVLAGTGHNDETQFNCFKDNGRTLYSDPDGVTCHSIYYCFDA